MVYSQPNHKPYMKLTITMIAISQVILQLSSLIEAYQDHELYTEKDNVIRLNETNFESHIYNPSNNAAYMVEFYNTYCGHCQAFAPVYKELGNRVKNWTSVARIAVIDCARDENVNICADNKVMGYPTIYFFPPHSHKDDIQNTRLDYRSLHYEWNVDGLEESIIDYLQNLTTSQRSSYPTSLNALNPIDVHNIKEISKIYAKQRGHDDIINEPSGRDFMLIIESHDSYIGRKLIIEYLRINDRLELRRVLLNNTQLVDQLIPKRDSENLLEKQPILIKLNSDFRDHPNDDVDIQILVRGELKSTLPTVESFERIDFVYERFKSFLEHYYSVELRHEHNPLRPDAETLSKPEVKMNSDQYNQDNKNRMTNNLIRLVEKGIIDKRRIFSIDLLKSITYIITHEILIKGDLNPFQFNILRNLLTVLKKYLPLDKWSGSLYKFINELRTRLDDKRAIYDKSNIKRQELRDLVSLTGGDDIREKMKTYDWATCYTSNLKDKGYTCSLWVLFHILTVSEYNKTPPVKTRLTLVLTTMRDYIINFFGCSVCSENFKRETANLEVSLENRNSSILWLWNTHNSVNERLNNERSHSQDKRPLAEVIFPRYADCSKCYRSDPIGVGKLSEIRWSMENVLGYLRDIYDPAKILSNNQIEKIYGLLMRKEISEAQLEGIYVERDNEILRLSSSGGIDTNKSQVDQERQGLFSTGDISLWLFLYISCIVIVVLVCLSLNPRWKRFKTM